MESVTIPIGKSVERLAPAPFEHKRRPTGERPCARRPAQMAGCSASPTIDRCFAPHGTRHLRCPCGGIGRRARLKIEFRKECWFDPGQGHQIDFAIRLFLLIFNLKRSPSEKAFSKQGTSFPLRVRHDLVHCLASKLSETPSAQWRPSLGRSSRRLHRAGARSRRSQPRSLRRLLGARRVLPDLRQSGISQGDERLGETRTSQANVGTTRGACSNTTRMGCRGSSPIIGSVRLTSDRGGRVD